ncbi:hypothetical protein C8R42DRAFT_466447 [Lentinula raphanica]|nr:hypothetical protein C8R42DRAFT_466447 [Lentinula raphanica]
MLTTTTTTHGSPEFWWKIEISVLLVLLVLLGRVIARFFEANMIQVNPRYHGSRFLRYWLRRAIIVRRRPK